MHEFVRKGGYPQGALFAAIPDPRWLRILAGHVFPIILLSLAARKLGFYPINVFFAVFWGLSIVSMGVSFMTAGASLQADRSSATYEMKERPNIYLFFLESYHPVDVQRDIYGIDTDRFQSYPANAGFTDYGKVYANSHATLISFADTFSFRSSRAFARGNSDAEVGIRYMLGGAESNTLLGTLKANGYTTVFLVGDTGYYGIVKDTLLDSSDGIRFPPRKNRISGIISCISMLDSRFQRQPLLGFTQRLAGLSAADDVIYRGSMEERVSQAVAAHMRPEAPLFLAFKGGAKHTPSNGSYTWRQHADWVRSGTYQEAVKKGAREVQRICDAVIANDPGAMIILLGDHGPHRFRDIEKGAASVDALKARLEERGISFPDFCDDRHAVFLAVRLPYGRSGDISYGLPLSHVNLFRHVFAYLNNDRSILADREPSESYWLNNVIVKEGRPVAE